MPNAVFDAEYEEALKKAKLNVEEFKESLNKELQQETITPCTHAPPMQSDNLSAKIGIRLVRLYLSPVSVLISDKIQHLAREGNGRARMKARRLADITKQVSMLRASNIEHEFNNEDALFQAIAAIRKSISDGQSELSNYRSKWGSAFFFGKILRMDLTKRVTSNTLIDNLTAKLDDIEKSVWGKIR